MVFHLLPPTPKTKAEQRAGQGLLSEAQRRHGYRPGPGAGALGSMILPRGGGWEWVGVEGCGVGFSFNKDRNLKRKEKFQPPWVAEEMIPGRPILSQQGSRGCRGEEAPGQPGTASLAQDPAPTQTAPSRLSWRVALKVASQRPDCRGASLCPAEDKGKSGLLYYSVSKQQAGQREKGSESMCVGETYTQDEDRERAPLS